MKINPIIVKVVEGVGDFELSRQIHVHLLKLGVIKFVSVANSLLSALWKCGASDDALRLFATMQEKDSVSWSTMIYGFYQSELYDRVLHWFARMVCELSSCMNLNRVSCIAALSSCAYVGNLMHGRELHGFLVKSGLDVDVFVLSGLLEFYMKCGLVRSSRKLFRSMGRSARENSVLWNFMIVGYVENRCYSEALCCFIEMMVIGVNPDTSTMVVILVLCTESLNLLFANTTLIDMYFSCNVFDFGLKLFENFHSHNKVMWGTIITNCVQCGYSGNALELFVIGV